MEGLGHDHGISRAVGHGQGFGGSAVDLDTVRHPGQLGPHPGEGLDGHDPRSCRDEEPSQLSRSRGEVDDGSAGAKVQDFHEAIHRRLRVGRAGALVGGGRVLEALGGPVYRHGEG